MHAVDSWIYGHVLAAFCWFCCRGGEQGYGGGADISRNWNIWGLDVMVMVYTVGHISGAHFSPAVAIAFATRKRFAWKHVICTNQLDSSFKFYCQLAMLNENWRSGKWFSDQCGCTIIQSIPHLKWNTSRWFLNITKAVEIKIPTYS